MDQPTQDVSGRSRARAAPAGVSGVLGDLVHPLHVLRQEVHEHTDRVMKTAVAIAIFAFCMAMAVLFAYVVASGMEFYLS